MGAIFISGGSGSGKTTFCNNMSSRYPITLETNVIRSLHKEESFSLLPPESKQLAYYTRYLDLHRVSAQLPTFKILSDRSLLNVLAFWEIPPDTVPYLGLDMAKPDLVILVPVPTLDWYIGHIDYLKDPIRISTYMRKAKLTEGLDNLGIANLFHNHDYRMYRDMVKMCELLNWNRFIPSYYVGDFQNGWQREAEEQIINKWKLGETSG